MKATKREPAEAARDETPARGSLFRERPAQPVEIASRLVHRSTRRDVLLFGAAGAATLVATGSLLPQATLGRLGFTAANQDRPKREWLLNKALRLDDDIAEALYSKDRVVPTYDKTRITPLKNNYNGGTPDPGYMPGWRLVLDGLVSGVTLSLSIQNLQARFAVHDQVTRLVCVEGWSAIAWWSGFWFGDLLHAYPPVSQAKWARIESSVNVDSAGNRDPYFVSLDLATAWHRQTLLATHLNGQPLTVEHGSPLRLLAPMKLGLKNVKAITRISYTAEEPADYWANRGYSRYDGI
jgi:DMSO/TMAO reductase YedYZ molybdopterin-dependent catalytic subunit